jgi:hypothetical protein
MISLCEFTIVIAQLPCLVRMAKAVSSTVQLGNSVTSGSVNPFNFAMEAFATQCFRIELVPCSDGWRRTSSQTVHMMPGLPVFSILQCKLNRHEGTWLELCQALGRFKPICIEAHQALKMICKVRLLKSRTTTVSFLEDIITTSNEEFKDFESDMAVGIRKLCNPTRENVESDVTV